MIEIDISLPGLVFLFMVVLEVVVVVAVVVVVVFVVLLIFGSLVGRVKRFSGTWNGFFAP